MVSAQLATLIFGLSAAIAWGMADFLAAKASKKNSPESTALWASLISVAVYGLIYIFVPGKLDWDGAGVAYAVGAGICLEFGLYTLYKGLAYGPVSLVSPVSSAYPLITTLIYVVVFKDSLSLVDVAGIVLVTIGVMCALGILNIRKSDRKISKGVIFGILTILLWGAAYSLLGQAVELIGWQKATLIDTSTGLVALGLLLAVTARKELKQSWNRKYITDKFIVSTAFAQLLGGIIFTIGLSLSHSGAVITAISACYPALTIFLALRYFEEKKQYTSIAGGIITIIGVVILSV